MRNPVVDVVVIGAMKCGTTALYHFFKKNNRISVNKKKEVNFFLEEFDDASLVAYDKTFLPGQVRVDVSPNYSKRQQYAADIPSLIAQANPDVKLIYLVRDPIDRIQSHLYHNLLYDRIDRMRMNDMRHLEQYVLTSSYLFQIAPFLKAFSKEKICVIQQESMKGNAEAVIGKLASFIGAPFNEWSMDAYYSSERRYKVPKYDLAKKVLGPYIFSKVYNRVWARLNIKPTKPILNEDTKGEIRERLYPDISEFCTMFSLDKRMWKTFFPETSSFKP